jgi:hypothetical protein
MLKRFSNYIKESNSTGIIRIECQIDKMQLFKASGKNNIEHAIKHEFNWTESINIINIKKYGSNYILTLDVNDSILDTTDKLDIIDGVIDEFKWLKESGIIIKNIIDND